MKQTTNHLATGLLLAAGVLAACQNKAEKAPVPQPEHTDAPEVISPQQPSAKATFNPRLLRRFKPVRQRFSDQPVSEAQVSLGRKLYYEKRISGAQDIACNTCHRLDHYGVDGDRTSLGFRGQRGGRNSPTTYHAAGYFRQFWDGRAETVEEQAVGPILNPIEMAAPNAEYVEAVLKSMPEYVKDFEAAYPGQPNPVTLKNVGTSIGAFERGLSTPSRWDKYLAGEKTALTAKEVEGLRIFTNVGCMVCHTGELLGGSMYEKAGVVEPWPSQKDQGRYEVTKQTGDAMMFKVPTLRNIAETAPYFHDGSAKTLDEAVRMMGKHQLGLDLDDDEVASVVTWLKSLTGDIPKAYTAKPQLPPSTPSTPKAAKP